MKLYIASVINENRKIQIIESEYNSKKDFAMDLRCNGYKVRFITTKENFDDDCIKYNEKLERNRDIQKRIREYKK